ncbi:MAG: hypothetical protein V3V01_19845 [Acidimicrobiales bacterium]
MFTESFSRMACTMRNLMGAPATKTAPRAYVFAGIHQLTESVNPFGTKRQRFKELFD